MKKSTLPPPGVIRDFYDRQVQTLGGEYMQFRWGGSKIQRKHFEQTRSSLTAILGAYPIRGKVLEIGAGPAVWTELYIGDIEALTLLDISVEMLKAAKARIDSWAEGRYSRLVEFVCGDALEVSFPSGVFDSIITVRALEYFSDKRQFLERCARWLRPGGQLIVGTKNFDWKDAEVRRESARTSNGDVGAAMQTDLVSTSKLVSMAQDAGLHIAEIRPLVFGSYLRSYRLPGFLWYFDRLHRRYAFKPMTPGMTSLIESYTVIARRPASGDTQHSAPDHVP